MECMTNNDKLIRELTVKINKIFHSSEFIDKYCNKFKFAPNGMTLDIDECFTPTLVVKHYGYNSSSNTGLSIYDDLGDYDIGNEKFTDSQFEFVINYFKENEPDIYRYFNI